MSISLIQIINSNAKAIKLFNNIEECYQYIQNMRSFTINDESKTIISHISSIESIDMDGYYLQKTDDINIFNVIKRYTELINGYIYNTIKQTCEEIGTIQIVKLPKSASPLYQMFTTKQYSDNKSMKTVKTTAKCKSNLIPTFSAEIQEEFFEKLQIRNNSIKETK
jgi:hypothetical protein